MVVEAYRIQFLPILRELCTLKHLSLQMESEFNLELHKSCDTQLTPKIGEIERI